MKNGENNEFVIDSTLLLVKDHLADILKGKCNGSISLDAIDNTENTIKLTVLGIEENNEHNKFEKLTLSEKNQEGNEIEYRTLVPLMINIKLMLTPYCTTTSEAMKVIGILMRSLKDKNSIPLQENNWATNDANELKISTTALSITEQMQYFSILNIPYSPSLFFTITVGINSHIKENIRRVEQRNFYAVDKNQQKK